MLETTRTGVNFRARCEITLALHHVNVTIAVS